MNSMYFVLVGDSRKGPFSLEDLRRWAAQDPRAAPLLVWTEGMSSWLPLGYVLSTNGGTPSSLPPDPPNMPPPPQRFQGDVRVVIQREPIQLPTLPKLSPETKAKIGEGGKKTAQFAGKAAAFTGSATLIISIIVIIILFIYSLNNDIPGMGINNPFRSYSNASCYNVASSNMNTSDFSHVKNVSYQQNNYEYVNRIPGVSYFEAERIRRERELERERFIADIDLLGGLPNLRTVNPDYNGSTLDLVMRLADQQGNTLPMSEYIRKLEQEAIEDIDANARTTRLGRTRSIMSGRIPNIRGRSDENLAAFLAKDNEAFAGLSGEALIQRIESDAKEYIIHTIAQSTRMPNARQNLSRLIGDIQEREDDYLIDQLRVICPEVYANLSDAEVIDRAER